MMLPKYTNYTTCKHDAGQAMLPGYKRYDLHVHTHFSQCAAIKPEQLIKIAKKRKLDGIAITDHNTIKGALLTKKLSKKTGLNIIISEEVSTNKGHLLVYTVQEEIKKKNIFEVLDEAKKQGCTTVIAHPFTTFRKKFLQSIPSLQKKVHGIEVFNARDVLPQDNKRANKLADELCLGKTAGSDAHYLFEVGTGTTLFKGELKTALKQRKTIIQTRPQIKSAPALLLSLARKIRSARKKE